MIGLLRTPPWIAAQIDIETEAVDHPDIVDLLTKRERSVMFRLKEHNVVPLWHWIRSSEFVQLIRCYRRLHPYFDNWNSGDEGSN